MLEEVTLVVQWKELVYVFRAPKSVWKDMLDDRQPAGRSSSTHSLPYLNPIPSVRLSYILRSFHDGEESPCTGVRRFPSKSTSSWGTTTNPQAQARTASLKPITVSTRSLTEARVSYHKTVGAFPLNCRSSTSLRRSYRWKIIPMLLLHTHTNPFKLVVEVLVIIIQPGPNLLLYVTGQ